MDLPTVIIVTGTLMAAMLFFADKYLHHNSLQTRKNLLVKFRDVKGKSIKLHEDIERLMSSYQKNPDVDYYNKECLDILKEKIEIEYSEAEYIKLMKVKLTKERIIEYTERFRYHQDALISLRQDYNRQFDNLHNKISASLRVV